MGSAGDFLMIGAMAIVLVGTYLFFKDKLPRGGGGSSCSGSDGNCTWDTCNAAHQSFCWESRSSSDNFFKTCTSVIPGKTVTLSQGCAGARAQFCKLHSADGKCTSNKCPAGKALNYSGVCV